MSQVHFTFNARVQKTICAEWEKMTYWIIYLTAGGMKTNFISQLGRFSQESYHIPYRNKHVLYLILFGRHEH